MMTQTLSLSLISYTELKSKHHHFIRNLWLNWFYSLRKKDTIFKRIEK